jgi:UDP-glucuronate 4-epimerase
MAMFLFADTILRSEPILVFNNGNMKRDFTYIDDIIAGTRSAIHKNYKCELFNLGNHRSEQLMDVVHLIEENLGKKAEIKFLPMQPGDVAESFADIDKSLEMLRYKPTTNVDVGINKFVEWYNEYHCDR